MTYTVGEVAARSGVTVRTLHHYDEIGLLVPRRSPTGTRLYDATDMDRLAEILTYRALGFGLDRIAEILDDGADAVDELRRQRLLVSEHIARLERVLVDLDERLEGHTMEPEKLKELFGDFDPDGDYAAEAEERWGDTEIWAESQRRTKRYGATEWARIKAEGDDIANRFGVLVDAGEDPASDEAMDLAEAHRAHISRWFYDCSTEIHVGLGEMYVTDPRFRDHWEAHGEGVASFVSAAIMANANRAR